MNIRVGDYFNGIFYKCNLLTKALLIDNILEDDIKIIEILLSRFLLSTVEKSYKELEDIEKRRGKDLSDKKKILEPLLKK